MDTELSRSPGGLLVTVNRYGAHETMHAHVHRHPCICIVLGGVDTESTRARTLALALASGAILGHSPGDRHENAFSQWGGRCLNVTPAGPWQDNALWMDCLHDRTHQALPPRPARSPDSGRTAIRGHGIGWCGECGSGWETMRTMRRQRPRRDACSSRVQMQHTAWTP